MGFALVLIVIFTFLILSGQFNAAFAYVGPGIGITMLGALWAVIVAVALAVGGILFWPIRAFILRCRSTKKKVAPKDT